MAAVLGATLTVAMFVITVTLPILCVLAIALAIKALFFI